LTKKKKPISLHDCIIEPKFEFCDGFGIEGKFQTTNNNGSVTGSKKNAFIDGLKLSLEGNQIIPSGVVNHTITPGLVFDHSQFYIKATYGYPMEPNRVHNVGANFVIRPVDNTFFGFRLKTPEKAKNAEESYKFDYEAKLAGKFGSTSGHLAGGADTNGTYGKVFVNHPWNESTTVGVRVEATVIAPVEKKEVATKEDKKEETKTSVTTTKKSDPAPSVTNVLVQFAANHKLSKQTSVAGSFSISQKLGAQKDEDKLVGLRLGGGFTHNLNSNVNVTLGADVNLATLLHGPKSGGDGHSLGLELKFK